MDIQKEDVTIIGLVVGWLLTVGGFIRDAKARDSKIARLEKVVFPDGDPVLLTVSAHERKAGSCQALFEQKLSGFQADLGAQRSRIDTHDSKLDAILNEIKGISLSLAEQRGKEERIHNTLDQLLEVISNRN